MLGQPSKLGVRAGTGKDLGTAEIPSERAQRSRSGVSPSPNCERSSASGREAVAS